MADDHPATCLVDSGATHNFVSQSWVETNGLKLFEGPNVLSIALADGRRLIAAEKSTSKLRLVINGYECFESLTAHSYEGLLHYSW